MYTTWGSVRGDCGHVHQTEASATVCLIKDQKGCLKNGGYSDRRVRKIENRDDIRNYDVTSGPGQVI